MYLVLTFLFHWGIILRTHQVQFRFHRDYEQGQCGGEGPHIHTPQIGSIVCRFYYKHCPLTFQTQRHLIVFDSKRLINPAGNPVRKQTNMKLLFCISHPTKNECIYKHPFIYFPSVLRRLYLQHSLYNLSWPHPHFLPVEVRWFVNRGQVSDGQQQWRSC